MLMMLGPVWTVRGIFQVTANVWTEREHSINALAGKTGSHLSLNPDD
jgi:hypothetical protein